MQYLDPEGTLSQALKRRIGAQHTTPNYANSLKNSIKNPSKDQRIFVPVSAQ